MGIGASVFLMAIGAILTFAVHATVVGLNIAVVGVILMVAGAFGLVMTLLVWGPRTRETAGTAGPVQRTTIEREIV